jgi:hypothetical protein
MWSHPGLPDDIFAYKISQFWYIFEGLGMENVGIFYDNSTILRPFAILHSHLVYFVLIWYILYSFGIFCTHLVYFVLIWYILYSFGIFSLFCYVVARKIWQPWSNRFHMRLTWRNSSMQLHPCCDMASDWLISSIKVDEMSSGKMSIDVTTACM